MEYYDNLISKVKIDVNNIQVLMKHQIHNVKSALTNFNSSLLFLNKNEETLNNNIGSV